MDEAELAGQLIDLEAQIENLNKMVADANVQAYQPDDTPTAEDFNTTVAEIRKRDACSRTAALAKARKESPAAFEAFNAGPAAKSFSELVQEEIAKGAPASVAGQRVALRHPNQTPTTTTHRCKTCGAYAASDQSTCPNCDAPLGKSVTDFMAAVDAVMAEQEISRTEAMTAVRKRSPQLYEDFQEV